MGEPFFVLMRAEIKALKELGGQDDICALPCGFLDIRDGFVDIRLHIIGVGGLDGGDGDHFAHGFTLLQVVAA